MYTHAEPKAVTTADNAHTPQRPATGTSTAQAKLEGALNDSARVQSQHNMSDALNQSSRATAQAKLVQLMSIPAPVGQMSDGQGISDEEELIQSKSAVQRQNMEEDEPTQMKSAVAQRKDVDEDELAQMKSTTAQRQDMDEEELTQMKSVTVQRQDMQDEDELIQQVPVQREVNSTGMPDQLKSGIENLSGMSMDSVKVHYNSPKPAALQAHAYTQGSDIHVASGQEQHLPHEAWHVVQQAEGRVRPTMQLQGTAVNDDPGLENEADVMGAKALQMVGAAQPVLQQAGSRKR